MKTVCQITTIIEKGNAMNYSDNTMTIAARTRATILDLCTTNRSIGNLQPVRFSVRDIIKRFTLASKEDKHKVSAAISKLDIQGITKQVGKKGGQIVHEVIDLERLTEQVHGPLAYRPCPQTHTRVSRGTNREKQELFPLLAEINEPSTTPEVVKKPSNPLFVELLLDTAISVERGCATRENMIDLIELAVSYMRLIG